MRLRRSLGLVSALVLAMSSIALLSAGASAATTTGGPAQAPLTPAQAQALSTNVTKNVIVVFKDQVPSVPDTASTAGTRRSAVAAVQAPVLQELSETKSQNVHSLDLLDAVAARVSPGEASRLGSNPAVADVVPDEPIPLVASLPSATASASQSGLTPLPGACAPNGQVQLDPQAIETIHAASQDNQPSAQALGYTGAGVKVAFIADGLDINNPDFIRPDGQHVFVDYQDFSNTGSAGPTDGAEAFLDASSIAAQGREVYNVASYGVGLDQPCNIRILGVAPGASLVGLNVFGSLNEAFDSVFLEAIDYAVNVDHVNVISESFGDNPFPDEASLDLTKIANEAAVAAGVTVVVSSGDSGSTSTIGSPATDPDVISAGASTTYRAYAQTGIGGITLPGVTGWLDNNISGLSSGGFDQGGSTVDVVAPGDLNWALCTPDPAEYAACTNFAGQPASVELEGGTSEAAPLTSGTAALVIQAYSQSHRGALPSPAVVKQIITSTAENIDAPADQQGAGLIDAYQAVLAARSYPTSSGFPDVGFGPGAGDAVLSSLSQLHAAALPGTTQVLSDTVTNDGRSPQTLSLTSRTLGSYRVVDTTTVDLSDSTGNLAEVQFVVPPGMARLDGSIAFVGAGPTTDFAASVDMSLIDPNGDLAEYNLPQGTGNFSDAQVADPVPGLWTAWISGAPSSDGGTAGPVLFEARVANWVPFGSVSPTHLQLAPGASSTVQLTVPTPASPGDEAGSIVISSNAAEPTFAATTSVPVTLRSYIPSLPATTTFSGIYSGGNGRVQSDAQSNYYQIEVPAGTQSLDATVTAPNNSDEFVAELIDPVTDEAASTASNAILGASSAGSYTSTPEDGAQLHVLSPDPGLWTLIVDWYGQTSGTALFQPFTVTVSGVGAQAYAPGLPDSPGSHLSAGHPMTLYIRVKNTGSAPEAYFVDSRLENSTNYDLATLTSSSIQVPLSGAPPMYFVPSHTTSITASVTASVPIFFDFWQYFGDPDIFSSTPPPTDTPSGTFSSSSVEPGLWSISPFQDGPDGKTALPPATATASMTATSLAFDQALTSATGDLWLTSIDPSTAVDPWVAQPGQTVTIPVTIDPSAAPGTTVQGTIFVDDVSYAPGYVDWVVEELPPAPTASDVAALPYEYTVK